MLRVAVHTDGVRPQVFEFPFEGRVTFGRAPENHIVLDPTYVSRFHGEFVKEDEQWTLVDLGSRTGLRVVRPDAPEAPTVLHEGDRLLLQGGEAIHLLYTVLRVELKPSLDLSDPDASHGSSSTFTLSPIAATKLSESAMLPKNLRADSRKLELLLDLAKDLNRLEDLDDVLERISRTVFESLPTATHFSICVPHRDGHYEPMFGALRDGSAVPASEICVSQSLLEQTVDNQIAMLFDPTQLDVMSESIVANRIASSIAVPLRGSREHIGVMQVDNRSSKLPFSQKDLDYTVAIGSNAAFALERARLHADIQRMFEGFVDASITAIEARDPTTSGHSRRVAELSVALAEAITRTQTGPLASAHFTDAQLTELSYAALLHDFGKVGVAECILLKANRLYPEQLERIQLRSRIIRAAYHNALLKGALAGGTGREEALASVDAEMRAHSEQLDEALALIQEVNSAGFLTDGQLEQIQRLAATGFPDPDGERISLVTEQEVTSLSVRRGTLTQAERRAIESHVTQSFRVLEQIPWSTDLENVPSIVLAHHEKLDGSGYPQGLRAPEIPTRARLLTVCDIFDAVTASDRPYRSAMPIEGGLDILRTEGDRGEIDSDLVELFIDAHIWERTHGAH
ncbi:MAG: HD domain-containing phosphohydrolase [Myxococcota bacterium]